MRFKPSREACSGQEAWLRVERQLLHAELLVFCEQLLAARLQRLATPSMRRKQSRAELYMQVAAQSDLLAVNSGPMLAKRAR